jgi:Epoxide hydrolase N terminus
MAQSGTTLPSQPEIATAESSATSAQPAAKSAEREPQTFILGEPIGDRSIRPFSFHALEDDLADLKRRIRAVRWPERELADDGMQGVQLALMAQLARYWETDYDWRRCEAQLNALPNFITEIDGLDIHFIHVRSKHEGALPLIVTHGWPGSPVEQLKIVGPLTDPTAYGGTAADAFDVIIPIDARLRVFRKAD